MVALTYVGPLRRGIATTAARHVPFTAGVPVLFTVEEAAALDRGCWSGRRTLPAPSVAVLEGTVAQVLHHVADHPGQAAALLAAERAGRARSTLMARLSADATTTAVPDDQPQEA